MKFPFLFKPTEGTAAKTATSAWPWPTCVSNPRTLSFRAKDDTTTATIFNCSAYVQENDDDDGSEDLPRSPPSYFISQQENRYEVLLRSSDRLFFEPGETNFILEEVKKTVGGVTVVAVDSFDPLMDFRVSMVEMVAAHRLRRWESLEDLLTRYLELNAKSNHGFIIGAFVGLLLSLSFADDDDDGKQRDNSCSCSSAAVMNHGQGSFTSPLSFCSSGCSFRSPSMEAGEGLLLAAPEKKISSNSYSSSLFFL